MDGSCIAAMVETKHFEERRQMREVHRKKLRCQRRKFLMQNSRDFPSLDFVQ